MAAFDSELHAEDRAMDTPKIRFSANKILTGRFFDNLSDDILNHHSELPFVTRYEKIDHSRSNMILH